MAIKDTQVITGKVRFSFCHLFEPYEGKDGDSKAKYSVTLLIPKADKATLAKIKAATKAAADKYRDKNGAKSFPEKYNTTIHDGDGVRESGEPYGEECHGCYVITVTSNKKPMCFDKFKNEITDPDEIYSGCYGRASINFSAYVHKGKKGVSGYVNSVMKLHDGEPLGGAVATADDYDDDYEDDYDDDLDGLL